MSKTEYNENAMRNYEKVPTLCVKANMGIGKTIKLVEYIEGDADLLTIVIISFRRTFTSEVVRRLPKFESYLEIEGMINLSEHPRVIVQVESIHRLCSDVKLDLLILDESESNLSQFNSGLNRHVLDAHAVFKRLMKDAVRVIAMDANLSNRTMKIMSRYRPAPIYFHHNKYKNKTDHVCNILRGSQFMTRIVNDLMDKDKLAIATNVKTMAVYFHKEITRRFPDLKVLLLTGDTAQREKTRIYSNVNETLIEYDVIIYTPTMTAGVSFEREHFDKLYGYFISETCDGYTCDQMMGRIRILKKKEYNVFIKQSKINSNLPETADEIRKKAEIETEWPVYIPRDGDDVDPDFVDLWIENRRVQNSFRNNFHQRMMEILITKGYKISN